MRIHYRVGHSASPYAVTKRQSDTQAKVASYTASASNYLVVTPDHICPCISDICFGEARFWNMSLNQPVYSQFNHERHLRKGGREGGEEKRRNKKADPEIDHFP